MKLSEKILETLEREQITPRPRWHFLLQKWIYWSLLGLFLLFSSLTAGMIFSEFDDPELWNELGRQDWWHRLAWLPFSWVVVTILLLVIVVLNFRHTNRGYRHRPLLIAGLSFIIAIGVGWGLAELGTTSWINEELGRAMPMPFMSPRHRFWSRPDQGFLSGRITSSEMDIVEVDDFTGQHWFVNLQQLRQPVPIPPVGQLVKIRGRVDFPQHFRAFMIRPWRDKGDMLPPPPPPPPSATHD